VGTVVVVVVLPLSELVVEDFGVVDDQAVEQCIELFGVDAVGPLHLCVRVPILDVRAPPLYLRQFC
jgi:hypothetical protein